MFRLEVFKKASLCRNFENILYEKVQEKLIKFPVYLSAGQEFIASAIAEKIAELKISPDIFIQHRGHSTYLAFGGSMERTYLIQSRVRIWKSRRHRLSRNR